MKFLKTVSALAIVLALSASAAAQNRGNLRLTGRVLDPAGKPVPEAQVSATKRGDATAEKFSATTNDKGEYSINNLTAGVWIVRGEKEGVGTKEVDATLADGARSTTVDITIEPPHDGASRPIEVGSGRSAASEGVVCPSWAGFLAPALHFRGASADEFQA